MSEDDLRLEQEEQPMYQIIQDHEYTELSEEEQQRYNEFVASLSEIEQARKWRTLFDNAPPETLPFIIYCTYVSANALIATIVLISNIPEFLPLYVLIGGAMILPLFALPSWSFMDTYNWIRNVLGNI